MKHVLKAAICLAACAVLTTTAYASQHQAAGDFDGDGTLDTAHIEAQGNGGVLVLALSNGKMTRKTLPKLNVDGAAIATASRGTEYTDACLRGIGKACADTAATRVVLEADGVLIHQSEAASILYYLKGGSVKSLAVSD